MSDQHQMPTSPTAGPAASTATDPAARADILNQLLSAEDQMRRIAANAAQIRTATEGLEHAHAAAQLNAAATAEGSRAVAGLADQLADTTRHLRIALAQLAAFDPAALSDALERQNRKLTVIIAFAAIICVLSAVAAAR